MCGIAAIIGKEAVNQALFDSLTVLQHRGQDAAGIMTYDADKFYLHKGNGLAKDVFRTRHMANLIGNMGIAHVRYPTTNQTTEAEAQPFYVNSPYGLALAHNGSLTNLHQLSEEIYATDLRHINTESDAEVLLNILAHELSQQGRDLTPKDIFTAISGLYSRCEGGYAAVAMIRGYGLIGFRDPQAIRPLVFGKRSTPKGTEYMIASESVALDAADFELIRDLHPGEAIFIDMQGQLHTQVCVEGAETTPCIFEYVYLARPDSIMDGISVYHARMKMGEKLASKIKPLLDELQIDVVIPIPDTSRTSALELAKSLKLSYREGFIKNRYIGRTFIMPGQTQRKKSVKQKLNAIDTEFAGKNVLLVDDSIVRGTTCNEIIQMAREAGAKKVYFASAAPAVRYPNVYGIDMPAAKELIAHGLTEQQVEEKIGADRLIYQELDDLIAACQEINPQIKNFDCSVFNGCYPAGKVDANYLADLDKRKSTAKPSALTLDERQLSLDVTLNLHKVLS